MPSYKEVKQEKILGSNSRIILLNTVIDVLDISQTIDLVEKYVVTKNKQEKTTSQSPNWRDSFYHLL